MTHAAIHLREHYASVRQRLEQPAHQPERLVLICKQKAEAKPLLAFHRALKRRPKWIQPVYVYASPVGPLQPPSAIREVLWPKETSLQVAHRVLTECCAAHHVSHIDVVSERRDKRVVLCRHEVMYRLRHETRWSLPQIGHFLGKRDHTAVLHGVRRHEQRMREASAS